MPEFPIHTIDSAPEEARAALRRLRDGFAFVPNLHGGLAEAPAALAAYLDLSARFDATSLTPAERQIVLLSASYENRCDYCMAAHSTVAAFAGLPPAAIAALRRGEPIAEPRHEALRRFTLALVRRRGRLAEAEVSGFLASGFTRSQVLEVLVGVALKTLSNYYNHLAHTPLDVPFAAQRWEAPAEEAVAAD